MVIRVDRDRFQRASQLRPSVPPITERRPSGFALSWDVAVSIEHVYDVEMGDAPAPEPATTVAIDDELATLAGQLNALHARLVEVAQRVLATGSWEGTGQRTPAAFLAWQLGLSPERAKMIVDVAARRSEFPTVVAMFDQGQLSLESEAGQDELLLGGLAVSANARGLVLDDHEVYDFTVPPILGAGFGADNITKRDFVVALNLAGQLHRQLRTMPPGTKISGFTFDGS